LVPPPALGTITGIDEPIAYGRNPYVNYESIGSSVTSYETIHLMTIVLGIDRGGVARAYLSDAFVPSRSATTPSGSPGRRQRRSRLDSSGTSDRSGGDRYRSPQPAPDAFGPAGPLGTDDGPPGRPQSPMFFFA
jgi:hypothetical protein